MATAMSTLNVLLVLLSFSSLFHSMSAVSGGFYADNGIDQTVFYPKFSKKERREMQQEILSLLGLDHRPKPHSHETETSAPRYMMDLYKYIISHDSGENSNDNESISFTFTDSLRSNYNDDNDVQLWHDDDSLHTINDADIIMSFVNHAHKQKHLRHSRNRRFWFDMSEVSVDDILLGAELRIFKESGVSQHSIDALQHQTYKISLYEILPTSDPVDSEFYLIDAINTTSEYEGWLYFNISKSASKWLIFPDSNYGLFIKIQMTGKEEEIHPREIHPREVGTKGREDHQPFMVAFFKTSRELHVRRTRATKQDTTELSSNDPSVDWGPFSSRYDIKPAQEGTCQKRFLYVSFKDLNWQDWIIAPDGYAAFYCAGECSFPLNAHMNAANHAIIQTLFHLMTPTLIPKPCCAATKLTSITVLYLDDHANVIIRTHKNMVVKSCGCN